MSYDPWTFIMVSRVANLTEAGSTLGDVDAMSKAARQALAGDDVTRSPHLRLLTDALSNTLAATQGVREVIATRRWSKAGEPLADKASGMPMPNLTRWWRFTTSITHDTATWPIRRRILGTGMRRVLCAQSLSRWWRFIMRLSSVTASSCEAPVRSGFASKPFVCPCSTSSCHFSKSTDAGNKVSREAACLRNGTRLPKRSMVRNVARCEDGRGLVLSQRHYIS